MEKRVTATRIRSLRRRLGLNLEQFARLVPCDQSAVYLWEQGLRLPKGLYRKRLEELLKEDGENGNVQVLNVAGQQEVS